MRSESIRTWLAARWADSFAQAIESMTGDRPEVRSSLQPYVPPVEESIRWSAELSLGPEFSLCACFPGPSWMAIGKVALQSAGVEDSDPESIRGTFLEILNQTFAQFAQEVGNRLEREVRCAAGQISDQSPPFVAFVTVLSGAPLEHGFSFPESLVEMVTAVSPPGTDPPSSGSQPSRRRLAAQSGSPTLDLLLDVELPVSVSFGRAQVALKEVLKLTSGSIVELNRTVSEPVEVIVNNCVIARGEVVVVEGNYGIRIHEIVSRQERLRTLN